MAEAMTRKCRSFPSRLVVIARKVVALQQNAFEHRVIGIHASIDIGDDSGAAHVKCTLRFG